MRGAPNPKPKPKPRNKFFRSGITGVPFVPKSNTKKSHDEGFDIPNSPNLADPSLFELPEKNPVILNTEIKTVWTDAYITFSACGETRNAARIKADEAVEDYLKRFSNAKF